MPDEVNHVSRRTLVRLAGMGADVPVRLLAHRPGSQHGPAGASRRSTDLVQRTGGDGTLPASLKPGAPPAAT